MGSTFNQQKFEDDAAALQPAVTLKEFGQCRQYARRLASMHARMLRCRSVQ